MGWKLLLSFIFVLFAILSLMVYWFVPLETNIFTMKPTNSNFSVGNNDALQFYPNMRFTSSEISYKIDGCALQKKDDMERAFEILSEETILTFHPVFFEEDISITCEERNRMNGGLFIAGEGGPTNVAVSGKFNIILNGEILLIKSSFCSNPNIALHELLHALGFDHSTNENNIMYEITRCEQTLGEDIPELINKLYSIPSYPDLVFENVSATMNGNYLNLNLSIRNAGLNDAPRSNLIIYANGDSVKTIPLDEIQIGHGRGITLENNWIKVRNVEKLEILIKSNFTELDKENNKVILEVDGN